MPYERERLLPFLPPQFLPERFRRGEVSVVALTGQAGAGKTTVTRLFLEACSALGIPAGIIEADWFLRLSSRARAEWLEEGKRLGPEEYARRTDEIAWWDLDCLQETLWRLRRGESVGVREAYNRADRGELTLTTKLFVPSGGALFLLEGMPVCHLVDVDRLVFFHAPPEVRLRRLRERDFHRCGGATLERWRITQENERRYYEHQWAAIDLFLETSQVDDLRIITSLSQEEAFRECDPAVIDAIGREAGE